LIVVLFLIIFIIYKHFDSILLFILEYIFIFDRILYLFILIFSNRKLILFSVFICIDVIPGFPIQVGLCNDVLTDIDLISACDVIGERD
jgi:hypothetical protein